MTRLPPVMLAIAIVALSSACSIKSPPLDAAQTVAEQFFAARMAGDTATALSHYSTKRPAETWQAHLDHIESSLGTLLSSELKGTEVNTVLSGRYYIFDYTTRYSGGANARETLTIFNKVDEEQTTIVAHDVSADGFQPLF